MELIVFSLSLSLLNFFPQIFCKISNISFMVSKRVKGTERKRREQTKEEAGECGGVCLLTTRSQAVRGDDKNPRGMTTDYKSVDAYVSENIEGSHWEEPCRSWRFKAKEGCVKCDVRDARGKRGGGDGVKAKRGGMRTQSVVYWGWNGEKKKNRVSRRKEENKLMFPPWGVTRVIVERASSTERQN